MASYDCGEISNKSNARKDCLAHSASCWGEHGSRSMGWLVTVGSWQGNAACGAKGKEERREVLREGLELHLDSLTTLAGLLTPFLGFGFLLVTNMAFASQGSEILFWVTYDLP